SLVVGRSGAACLVATGRLGVSPRLARRGAAGAASFWGLLLFLGGLGLLVNQIPAIRGDEALRLFLLTSVLAWAAGCWRWGSPVFAGLSAASLFVLLAEVPFGRVFWVVAGVALVGVAARRLGDGPLAPSPRRSATMGLLTGVAAGVVGVDVCSPAPT